MDAVNQDIFHMIYVEGLSLNIMKSHIFKKLKGPLGSTAKVIDSSIISWCHSHMLAKEVDRIDKVDLENHKDWKMIGSTLMSGGWTDDWSRPSAIFLVNSLSGTVFLKSDDTTVIKKSCKEFLNYWTLWFIRLERSTLHMLLLIVFCISLHVICRSKSSCRFFRVHVPRIALTICWRTLMDCLFIKSPLRMEIVVVPCLDAFLILSRTKRRARNPELTKDSNVHISS